MIGSPRDGLSISSRHSISTLQLASQTQCGARSAVSHGAMMDLRSNGVTLSYGVIRRMVRMQEGS